MQSAASYQIPMGIENHWGISSRPENIMKIVREIDSPLLGTCPDFGNFPQDVDRYEGLETLAAKAMHVHAKSRCFGRTGEEKQIDYKRCLQILQKNGYDDTLTVEYEGAGNDLKGCLKTKALIQMNWHVI